MNSQILKAGEGRIWGVSNDKEQPGKTLSFYDGEIVLYHLPLDKAFPRRVYVLPNGLKVAKPGIELNLIFVTNFRLETDGEIDIDWF